MDNSGKDKKVKGTKMCVIKIKIKFENYKTVQNQLNLRINKRSGKK